MYQLLPGLKHVFMSGFNFTKVSFYLLRSFGTLVLTAWTKVATSNDVFPVFTRTYTRSYTSDIPGLALMLYHILSQSYTGCYTSIMPHLAPILYPALCQCYARSGISVSSCVIPGVIPASLLLSTTHSSVVVPGTVRGRHLWLINNT